MSGKHTHSEDVERMLRANENLGAWMSAALDDPEVCDSMKRDINEWFDAKAALSTMNGEALEDKLVEAYEHGWDEGAESAVEEGQIPHHDTKNEGSGLYRQAIQRKALDRNQA